MHILIPQNTDSCETELKNVGDKSQDNNELIIHNTIINAGWNQMSNMVQVFFPLTGQLDNATWMNFNYIPFLAKIFSLYLLEKGDIWYGWFTAAETMVKNDSITSVNDRVDKSILDSEGSSCGIVAVPSIKITFDNDHIHVLHDILKR